MTALHYSAKSGHLSCIEHLLRMNNVDINAKDDGGWTAVIWAAEHRHLTTVEFLLQSGANPCLKDNEENSGLHWASFSGSADIAEMFLNAGCDLESPNEHGDRPL
jgi:ankyrin repeat protein